MPTSGLHRSKADQQARISTNEAQRRKECALAGLRQLELDQKRAALLPGLKVAKAEKTAN